MLATRPVRLDAEQRRRFSSVTAPLLESTAQVQPGIIRVATLELGFLPSPVGINIFLALYTPQASRARSVSRRAVRRLSRQECS